MRKLVPLVVLTLGLLATPTPRAADPVTLTGGNFRIHHEGDTYIFTGRSLDVRTHIDWFGVVEKQFAASCFIPFVDENCASGERFDLSFATPGEVSLGNANASIDGQTHSNISLLGTLQFLAEPTVIPLAGAPAFMLLLSPFVMNGVLREFVHDRDRDDMLDGSGTHAITTRTSRLLPGAQLGQRPSRSERSHVPWRSRQSWFGHQRQRVALGILKVREPYFSISQGGDLVWLCPERDSA